MSRIQIITRHALGVAFLLLLFVDGQANANGGNGINAVYYQITEIPPNKSDTEYQICSSEIENNLNRNFEGEPIDGCPDDGFMAHYRGFITVPDGVESVRFAIASDDGSEVTIGSQTFGSWTDKGCSIDYSERMQLPANTSLELDAWFYENGGGTCFMLLWQFNADNQDWNIVPDDAFTMESIATTTTVVTTTTQPTTTTFQTTTTLPVQTTTTEVEPPQLPTTTTTDMPITVPSSVYQPTSSSAAPTTTEATATTIQNVDSFTTTSVAIPNTSDVVTVTTSVLAPAETSPPIQNEIPQEGVDTAEAVLNALEEGVTNDEAKSVVLDKKVLETLDEAQATEIFAALALDELTETELAVLVENVQGAPTEVRQAFEEQINVFGGSVDSYVPLGSNVPVSTRRVLIAATAALGVLPTPTRKSR
jgi:hypothetical protein